MRASRNYRKKMKEKEVDSPKEQETDLPKERKKSGEKEYLRYKVTELR